MTVSTPQALANYHKALARWFKCGGPTGGGGEFDRKEKKYKLAPEPQPQEFGLDGFALKAAEQIKARELIEYKRMNP